MTDIEKTVSLGGMVIHVSSRCGKRPMQQDVFCLHEALVPDSAVLEEQMLNALTLAQHRVKTDYAASHGGTTISSICITKDDRMVCGNIGDSPVFLVIRHAKTGDLALMRLSTDHNLANVFERQRLGMGHVEDRAFGIDGHPPLYALTRSISAAPGFQAASIRMLDLKPFFDQDGTELYVVLSTDGITDHRIDEREYQALLHKRLLQQPDSQMAAVMTGHAISAGSSDNVTVVFARIPPVRTKDISLTVGDGHNEEGEKIARLATHVLARQLHKQPDKSQSPAKKRSRR